jgi:release factor glutamine methyltransferase
LLLLLHTLGISRAEFHADPTRSLTPDQQAIYESLIRRRFLNEPIQYITGEQEFYGLALHVTPAVLIPRPETEHLVEAVLTELDRTAPLHILDIGTGSGAIAIALAHHLPHAQITATDISPAALAIAATNAARHHLTHRIHFVESDLLDALTTSRVPHLGDSFIVAKVGMPRPEPGLAHWHAIVSNPPYIPIADRDSLHPQVRDHEPATALFAGATGLDIYRRLIPAAHATLKPNGLLALEIGHDQRDAIADLLCDWQSVHFVNDLQQIPRVALARRP